MNRLPSRPQRASRQRAGLSLTELLVVFVALCFLLAVVLPVIAGARGNSGVQQSMSNLMAMSAAHLLYAADWNGRQVTWVKDDLGVFGGSPTAYNGCTDPPCLPCFDPDCQPPLIAGVDCDGSGPWAYWSNSSNNIMFQPLLFPDSPGSCTGCLGWGHWRIPNLRPLHDYVNGRYHDPVYYAPNDSTVLADVEDCTVSPCEFNPYPESCNPGWSSYAMSPAAMYHADVMRSNAAGGFQAPWTLDHGYQSPGLFQALYPDLKTHMIEHNWIQGPPAECNPAFLGCEPYWFNHGIGSTPVTLFYDGHVRLLPNTEVLAADEQVLKQTGGVDGLWHRGTSFGANGYFIAEGYDGVPLSHHVLTTDGILGRDTISGPVPQAPQPPWPRAVPAVDSLVGKDIALHRAPVPFSPEEDKP